MSHTMKVQVDMKDRKILEKAAKNIGATVKDGLHKLYSESVNGTGVYLKGWKYPVVIDNNGECKFDNYNGNWGGQAEFDKLKQQYSVVAVQEKLAKAKLKGTYTTNAEGNIVIKVKLAV